MIIAVDFDGTIVHNKYPLIGNAVYGAKYWINQFKEAGATLILYTMRSDGEHGKKLTEALDWCRQEGLQFDYVNFYPASWTTSPKPYADIYIDDRAFGCPRIHSPVEGISSYVDWVRVGPAVIEQIRNNGPCNQKEGK